jgi:ATPase subunit of ABC transporter with duplicated ATPase domains
LEMLEHALAHYPGTVLLVSHDQYLRERVCDSSVPLASLSPTYVYM